MNDIIQVKLPSPPPLWLLERKMAKGEVTFSEKKSGWGGNCLNRDCHYSLQHCETAILNLACWCLGFFFSKAEIMHTK